MVQPGTFNPPPPPPAQAPWEDVQSLIKRMDTLIGLMTKPAGAPTIIVPGAPGGITSTEQMINIMLAGQTPEAFGPSQVLTFQKSIATATQDEMDRNITIDGIVRDVLMSFPAGCQQLVEVRLVYYPRNGGYTYVVPTLDNSFIALDDFTAVFQPRFPVRRPGNLRVEWWNYDSLNTHTVPVIVTLAPSPVGGS